MEELVKNARSHLGQINADPSTLLDIRLLEDLKRKSEADGISTEDQLDMFKAISSALGKIQQDPTPLVDLMNAFLDREDSPSFAQIISMDPEIDLIRGLRIQVPPVNQISLRLLQDSCRNLADVGLVAGKPDVVLALIDMWLTTPFTAIATQAETTLADLLGAESPVDEDEVVPMEIQPARESSVPAPMGLMWRRIFNDKNIYRSMFSHCSLKTLGQPGQIGKAEKTRAQARLFGLLKHIFYAPQIWESQNASVEQEFDVSNGGILDFALSKMVDWKDDLLMHNILIRFYEEFISYTGPQAGFSHRVVPPVSKNPHSSLERMKSLKLHDRTISYYLKPDPNNPLSSYLYGAAGGYIGAYAIHHTEHFRLHTAPAVLRKLLDTVNNIRPSEWANDRLPNSDLLLLSKVPRRIYLDLDPSGGIISNIAIKPTNFTALSILQQLFPAHPRTNESASPMDATTASAERMAARALFSLYLNHHPTFWQDLTKAADVRQGNFDAAQGALILLQSLVNSQWERLPSTNPAASAAGAAGAAAYTGFPTESELRDRCPRLAHSLPLSGAVLMVTEPAIGIVLPWLVEPPPRLPASAAPAGSDERDQGWDLARRKHDVLKALRARLADIGQGGRQEDGGQEDPPPSWRHVLELLERRERMGPWGDQGQQTVRVPEPEVGTMEL